MMKNLVIATLKFFARPPSHKFRVSDDNNMTKTLTLYVCFALALMSMGASADDIRNAQVFRKIDAATRVCMRDSVKVQLKQGVSDKEEIANFAISTCSGAMRTFEASVKEWPRNTIEPMLRAMAYNEIIKIPGLVQTPKN
jgi:hypothetical protein